MDKYTSAQVTGQFRNEMLRARDMLKPIIEGEIERGHCLPGKSTGYLDEPGMRKTKLKDAVGIAKHIVALINRAVDEFDKDIRGLER